MVNLHGSGVTPAFGLAFVRLWHVLAGIYIWEFFTTLDYEWKVYRGQIPRRWTVWVYSLARVTGLLAVVLNFVGLDVTSPINCQVWVTFVAVLFCLSLGSSSLLIVLRIIAIWNRNKPVMATVIGVWVLGVGFHLQYAARLRSSWEPAANSCLSVTAKFPTGVLGLLPTIFADLTLVLIMLVGLILLHRSGSSPIGLTPIILKQGFIWLFLSFISEAPQAVIALLSSNAQFVAIILSPGTIIMIIGATRMHRTLVDFAFGSRSISGRETLEMGSIAFSRSKPAHQPTASRIEVSVHRAFEHHSTSQKTDHGSSGSSNVQMQHEKPEAPWILGDDSDDVERGVM